ncbi:oxidoreductase [Hyaloscypha variabilis F]|uniref:Oxidoreductase n=1 Tax=Hyaloscypha variabilis (strain UAMH 11265 / GT02V1 / F) TaxID=1149755 RepID=A0A2J6R1N8_HYAVF|nr:oxidoreductase [Hyaloscypha variabilis F]
MSSQPLNLAAYLTATKSTPLAIRDAPYPVPEANELIIRAHAVAINPVDYAIQAADTPPFPWVTLPRILGMDLSGIVVETGSSVTRFKPGDRVLAASDVIKKNASGAFQHFVVAQENMTSQIPESATFEEACVLPLCLAVAACGLFGRGYLALEYPTVPATKKWKTVLVWGGSTSVGCNAIQLGVAAGYEVVTTCSPRNFEYVKTLGASYVFDYSSPTAVEEIIDLLKGKEFVGAVAIGGFTSPGNGTAAAEACLEIVSKSEGAKFVAMAMVYKGEDPEGVESKFILGLDLKDNELGAIIFEDFLPKALEEGSYVYAPKPLVVGKGLDKVQEAFEVLKKGVSAQKVVVSL